MSKLGFCFLIKGAVEHLPLWEQFFQSSTPGSVGIYVHAKTASPTSVLTGSWIDQSPLETAWGDLSLVMATHRLFSQAVADGCDSMVLLSGDMLPLQSMAWIRSFCARTRLSLQPRFGLSQRQLDANHVRFASIAPYLGLPIDRLRKQNMFFVITKDDFEVVSQSAVIDQFPLCRLADEYFWVNHLIRLQISWQESRVVYCNPDPTCTQALDLFLNLPLLKRCRDAGYAFMRKVSSLDSEALDALNSVYAHK